MTEKEQLEQNERITLLSEENAEVIAESMKILRHGMDSRYANNRALLMNEIGDVLFCVALLVSRGDISPEYIYAAMKQKASKVNQFLHHNYIELGEIESAFAAIKPTE